MPLNRDEAKSFGYTDEEIDEFMAQEQADSAQAVRMTPGRPAGAGIMQFHPETGPEEPGLEDTISPIDLMSFTGPARVAGQLGLRLAGRGLARFAGVRTPSEIAKAIGKETVKKGAKKATAKGALVASRLLRPIGRFLARRVPGVHEAEDIAKLTKGIKAAVTETAEEAAPRAGKVAKEAVKGARATRKPKRPPRGQKKARKSTPEPGTIESRLPPEPPQVQLRPMRLEIPQEAMAVRTRSVAPRARAEGPRPAEMQFGQPTGMEQALEQSIMVEQEMAKAGLAPAEKEFIRQQLQRALSGLE